MANSGRITERGSDGIAFETPTPAAQPGDVFPAGTVVDFAGSAAPTGWLVCDGSLVSRATYPQLFANIGTTYGAGDGSTTFNIPDCRGKVVHGKAASGTFQTLGATGGAETHTITSAEMPVHSHGVSDPGHGHGVSDPGHSHSGSLPQDILLNGTSSGTITNVKTGTGNWVVATSGPPIIVNGSGTGISIQGAGTGISIQNAGSGSAMTIVQPYIVLNKIIRAY